MILSSYFIIINQVYHSILILKHGKYCSYLYGKGNQEEIPNTMEGNKLKDSILVNQQQILQNLIVFAIVVVTIVDVLNIIYNPIPVPAYALSALLIVLCCCYILNWHQKTMAAVNLSVISILIVITINMTAGRGLLNPGVMVFPILILVYGLFLGSKSVVIITSITTVLIFFIMLMEQLSLTGLPGLSGVVECSVFVVLNISTGVIVKFFVAKHEQYIKSLNKNQVIINTQKSDLAEQLILNKQVTDALQISKIALNESYSALEMKVEDRTFALKKAVEEAKKANCAKSEFLANISHELRTPMHHIINFSRFGLDKYEKVNRDKHLHYFNQIYTSSKRLKVLLNDLLDISAMESRRINYKKQNGNMYRTICDIAREFQFSLEQKNITHLIKSESEEVPIFCDVNRIKQVFNNLIDNAIKHSPRGGEIKIALSSTLMPVNNTSVQGIKVSIIDQGPGIPDEELDAIFEKFTQSSKTDTGAGGTGLGLAISKEIIEAHGGILWAENNSGKGAAFNFILPIK